MHTRYTFRSFLNEIKCRMHTGWGFIIIGENIAGFILKISFFEKNALTQMSLPPWNSQDEDLIDNTDAM